MNGVYVWSFSCLMAESALGKAGQRFVLVNQGHFGRKVAPDQAGVR